MKEKIYWQGDVGFESHSIPKTAKIKDLTVALGETTGHHHTFKSGMVQVLIFQEQQFVKVVEKEAILIHQEHEPLYLPVGNYKVIRQRVFDTIKGIRQVLD